MLENGIKSIPLNIFFQHEKPAVLRCNFINSGEKRRGNRHQFPVNLRISGKIPKDKELSGNRMAEQKNLRIGFLFQNTDKRKVHVKMLLYIREQGRIAVFFNTRISHKAPHFRRIAESLSMFIVIIEHSCTDGKLHICCVLRQKVERMRE